MSNKHIVYELWWDTWSRWSTELKKPHRALEQSDLWSEDEAFCLFWGDEKQSAPVRSRLEIPLEPIPKVLALATCSLQKSAIFISLFSNPRCSKCVTTEGVWRKPMRAASLKASFGLFSDLRPFPLLCTSVLVELWALAASRLEEPACWAVKETQLHFS